MFPVFQLNKWSLDDLELYLAIDADHAEAVAHDSIVVNLQIEGAKWLTEGGHGRMELSDDVSTTLPPSRLQWRQKSTRHAPGAPKYVNFPLYMTDTRMRLMTEVLVSTGADSLPAEVWAQRGVAIIMQISA